MDYDALTGKDCDDTHPVFEKRKKSLVVRSRTREDTCCSRRCFVVTVVGLFLVVAFVFLPAGVFLIIHGNRKQLVGFQVGGALVVSVPILIGFVIGLLLCLRRNSPRKLSYNHPSSVQI